MNRLTKQYEDTKRYYSTHSCDEVVQKLGKLEDKEEPLSTDYEIIYGDNEPALEFQLCPICRIDLTEILKKHYKYCPNCGQRLEKEKENE